MNRELEISLKNHAPLFAEARGDIAVSFEFFPPKTEGMAETLWRSIEMLAPLHPRFVSVTYGAGGSTRERTHATVERIIKETELTPAAHLTCVGATRDEIDSVAKAYWEPASVISSRFAAIRPEPVRPTAPSGRLCQCGRTGRRPEAGRAVRNLGRLLSGMPSRSLRLAESDLDNLLSARSMPAPTAPSPNSSFRPNVSSIS